MYLSETTTPMDSVRVLRRERAWALGRKPSSVAASATRVRMPGWIDCVESIT